MRKIVTYTILREYSCDNLVRAVNNSIYNGWQPRGPVIITGSGYHAQAMVKYGDNE